MAMNHLTAASAVFVGSGLGGVCRYGVARLGNRLLNGRVAMPWPALASTLAVNLIGSLLLGWLVSRNWTTLGNFQAGSTGFLAIRLGAMTGFMGGFTTYSTFNTEVLSLTQSGRGREAFIYVLTTWVSCLIGGWIGMSIGSS